MSILLKSCPRCGGDVDATFFDDVYCIQCAYRPAVAFPGPRVVRSRPIVAEFIDMIVNVLCPKCGARESIRLDKLREEDNECYRCRRCGHVFSPAVRASSSHRKAAHS